MLQKTRAEQAKDFMPASTKYEWMEELVQARVGRSRSYVAHAFGGGALAAAGRRVCTSEGRMQDCKTAWRTSVEEPGGVGCYDRYIELSSRGSVTWTSLSKALAGAGNRASYSRMQLRQECMRRAGECFNLWSK